MSTPALVVDKEAIFDTALDGLLGGLHHLCRWGKTNEKYLSFIKKKKGGEKDIIK